MRPPILPLDEQFFEHPYRFEFFQAVRLLSLILNDRGLGASDLPSEEIVRFKVRQSLEFPASSIHSLDTEPDPPRMTVSFFGLTGVQGVLPHHYTEHLIARAVEKDFAMSEFLDIFNHRLISFFYRAWEKHHFPVRYQVARARGQSDNISHYLLDLVGLGTNGLLGRLKTPGHDLLLYAGLLAQAPHSASALQGILRDYFGVSVDVEQNAGEWYPLPASEMCDLSGKGIRNQLGEGAVAGDAVYDPQAGIRIVVGPLGLEKFLAFLPDGDAAPKLQEIVRLFIGSALMASWQPILNAKEVPRCRLGDETLAGPRLGWTAWLKTEEFEEAADDAVFEIT